MMMFYLVVSNGYLLSLEKFVDGPRVVHQIHLISSQNHLHSRLMVFHL